MFFLIEPIIGKLGFSAYNAYSKYKQDKMLSSIEESNADIIDKLDIQSTMLSDLQISMDTQSVILSGLQTSMSIVGATSIASLGLSAFSLYKINQLSKDIKNLSHNINNGFLDMKYFVSKEIQGLIEHQQKVKLSKAYEYYQKGVQILQRTLTIKDLEFKKFSLFKAMEHFDKALIIYDSQKKFQNLSPISHLKQLEIIIILEALKAETYIIIGEIDTGKDHYSDLLKKINNELKEISNGACQHTIDLILIDTFLLKNNDLKLIEERLSL